jgi:murein DD-endopeptidase MepM/ murein hydrolase activator NlpD
VTRGEEGDGSVAGGRQDAVFPLAQGVVLALALFALLWLPIRARAQEPTPEAPVYVVQPGDTLFRIAERFDTTVEAIVGANDIADAALIEVGQKLVIPTTRPELVPAPEPQPNRRVHPVRAGETLPALAFRYGTTVPALSWHNELGHLGVVWPGLALGIPEPKALHAGVRGYPEVEASGRVITQGQTLVVQVEAEASLVVEGWLFGQEIPFFEQAGGYWALAGVDALTPPGAYRMALYVEELDTGDLLTMTEALTVTKGNYGAYNIVVSPQRQNLLDPVLAQSEREIVNGVFAGESPERYWVHAFRLPMAGEPRTTAPFGQRRSYGGGPVTSYHAGHDYGADEGTPILAPITGTVALAEPLQIRGQAVILDHGLGVFSGFWHLSRIDVEVRQVVGQGDVIGLVGDTGLSTGPHLHWEMRVHGVPVDPLQWTLADLLLPLVPPDG